MNRVFLFVFALIALCIPSFASTPFAGFGAAQRTPRTVLFDNVDALPAIYSHTPVELGTLNLTRSTDLFVQIGFNGCGSFQNRVETPCPSYTAISGLQFHAKQGNLSGDGAGVCLSICGGELAAFSGVGYMADAELVHNEGFAPGSDHHGMPFDAVCPAQLAGRFGAGPVDVSLGGYAFIWNWASWQYGDTGHTPYSADYVRYRARVLLTLVPAL